MVFPSGIIKLPIIYEHPPAYNSPNGDKFILFISNYSHCPFLGHHLHQTHPCTVRGRVDNTYVKELDNLFPYYLFHIRIESSLGYQCWHVIVFHEDLMSTKICTNPPDISYFPSNFPFILLQYTQEFVLLLNYQIRCNNNWEFGSLFQESILQVIRKWF